MGGSAGPSCTLRWMGGEAASLLRAWCGGGQDELEVLRSPACGVGLQADRAAMQRSEGKISHKPATAARLGCNPPALIPCALRPPALLLQLTQQLVDAAVLSTRPEARCVSVDMRLQTVIVMPRC